MVVMFVSLFLCTQADVVVVVLLLLSAGHALSLWVCCRRRWIRDQPDRLSDRARRSTHSACCHTPLPVHIETDDSNLPRDTTITITDTAREQGAEGEVEMRVVSSNGGPHVGNRTNTGHEEEEEDEDEET